MKTSALSISCCHIFALCSGSMKSCRKNGNSFVSFVSFYVLSFFPRITPDSGAKNVN